MTRAMLFVVLAVAVAGCSACAGSAGAPPGRGSAPAGSPSSASASADVEQSSAAPASSSGASRDPAPVVAIRGTVEHGREVALAIENRGTTLARIAPRAGLEREVDGRFRSVDAITIELRTDCATEPPACVVLAPGAAFLPATWRGGASGTQCDARADRTAAAEPGIYRVVARTCEGGHRVEGEPFELTR